MSDIRMQALAFCQLLTVPIAIVIAIVAALSMLPLLFIAIVAASQGAWLSAGCLLAGGIAAAASVVVGMEATHEALWRRAALAAILLLATIECVSLAGAPQATNAF